MASTFSNLKIQLMATGENSGTWGTTTNTNLGTAIEQALVETATVTFASGDVTLTLTDSNSAQNARALRLNLTGTTGGARDLIVPAIQKPYIVNNGTADTITVKVSGQTGIAVPASTSMLLYNNGTDVGLAFNRVVAEVVGNVTGTASNATVLETARTIAISGNVTGTATSFDGSGSISIPVTAINVDAASAGTLVVAHGGTGASTLTDNNVILGNTTGAVKFVAPGTDGNVLTSNGTAWISEAAAAGGGDYIMQVFTTPGTYTKPAGLKAVKITVVAGGGASGASAGSGFAMSTQGGGGGGGAAIEYINAPDLPASEPYTVGGAGGASSFGGPTALLSATAGSAGSLANSPTVSAGAAGGAGGIGSNGQLNIRGGGGGGGGVISPAPPGGNGHGGAGGNSIFGGGGAAAVRGGGNVGDAFGGGGGGGFRVIPDATLPQKAGGAGVIIVEEFY